jgi:ribosome-associated protein
VTTHPLRSELRAAVEAAQNKKAGSITLLDLSGLGAFTNYFLLCTGFSTRQVTAIAEEIEEQVRRLGPRPEHREGRSESEWVLLDYGGFIVHVFTERARQFYDLDRLWRSARRTEFSSDAADGVRAGGATHRHPAADSHARAKESA